MTVRSLIPEASLPPASLARARTATVLRFFIALVLLATAAGKLLDLSGFVRILETYRAFSPGALWPIATAVALGELLLALWLFSSKRLAKAAAAALILHLVYAAWAAASLLRGLRLSNCGCFGVFLPRPLGWTTVLEDLVMAGLSAWLLALERRRA